MKTHEMDTQPQSQRALLRESAVHSSEKDATPVTAVQRSDKTQSILQMQRTHGNRYVQRMLAPSRKGDGESDVAPEIESAIQQARGTGQGLDSGVRAQMETAFGTDFSGVRVHTDAEADTLNRAVNARAFTTGEDIFFRNGEYNPQESSSRELLAHELTHVVQQTGGIQSKLVLGEPGDQYEQEADRVANHIVSMSSFAPQHECACRSIAGSNGECSECQEREAQSRRSQDEVERGQSRSIHVHHRHSVIQRDLATPPPAVAPAAQPDLTAAQIQSAIRANRARYDATGTRLIQDLVGTTPTGIWVDDDIRAVAALQEEYGLTKDGIVGTATFRFLDNEVRREALSRTDAHCLVALSINRDAENIVPSPTGAIMTRHFTMRAQFPSYCNCSDFEYRQFIRGHFTVQRGGAVHDLGNWFAAEPAGRLNAGWQEDGHTGVPSVNFGHRNRTSEPDNRYIDDANTIDMANGCRYEGDDTPGGNFTGWGGFVPTTGDILDIDVNFRGEIQRGGRVVRQEFWSALNRRFTLP